MNDSKGEVGTEDEVIDVLMVRDIRVEAVHCTHCGARSTVEDAENAIAEWFLEMGRRFCVVCQALISPKVIELMHVSDVEAPHWRARSKWPDANALQIAIYDRRVNPGFYIHLDCAKRAMPGIDPERLSHSRQED